MRSLTAISFSMHDHHQQLCKHIKTAKQPQKNQKLQSHHMEAVCLYRLFRRHLWHALSAKHQMQRTEFANQHHQQDIITRHAAEAPGQAAAEAPGSLSSETSTPGGMLLVVPPMHMTMDPGPRISSASVNASTPVSGRFSWRCTMASGGKAANPIVSIVEDRMISATISLPSSLSPLSLPPPPSPPILSASSRFFLIVL